MYDIIKNMLREYFYKKEYKYLYISRFSCKMAGALLSLFSAVVLWRNGIPIEGILLIYALTFGLMGILTPLHMVLSKRIGVAYTALIGNICRTISCMLLLFVDSNWLFLIIISAAISGAILHPISNTLASKYVQNEHRGKFNSLVFLCNIMGTILSSIIVTVGITTNNEIALVMFLALFFALDVICVKRVDFKAEHAKENTFKSAFKYLYKGESDIKFICAMRSFAIIERILLPLYIYLLFTDIVLFTAIIVGSLVVQSMLLLIAGRLTDNSNIKTFRNITILRIIASVLFIVLRTRWLIITNKIYTDIVNTTYESTFLTLLQNRIKKSKESNDFLCVICEMCICFVELIALLIFAFIAIYLQEYIFILIFISSAISMVLINMQLKKSEVKGECINEV